MELMKRLFLLPALFGALLCGQDAAKVHTVYLMPMGRGLDQYLANQLTRDHVFDVVTDPKTADAVFTDRLGPTFEQKLADLTNPEPVSPPPKDKDDAAANPPSLADALQKVSPPVSTFGAGKGTVFLVDPKTHHVLWSAYKPSRSSNSDDVNRTASDIVSRLKRDLKPKQ